MRPRPRKNNWPGSFASPRFVLATLALASCTPSGDANSVSAPRPPLAQPQDAGTTPTDAAIDADNSVGARYWRREWVITRGNGTLVFEAPGEWTCPPLPDKRPQDFTLILNKRDGETVEWTYFGVSETIPCHFPWSMSWLDPPKAACQAIGPEAFDRLYSEFRALSPHTIRTKKLEGYVSPHRGGWSVTWRWGQVECNVSDIWDQEVDARDQPRFDAAQDLVRKVYQRP